MMEITAEIRALIDKAAAGMELAGGKLEIMHFRRILLMILC